MAERIPQSVTIRVALKAYLSTSDSTLATGKTIAITLSLNGAAFGNPSGGATNATEIGNGWYYVDLSTTDTGTLGPLIVRGTASTIQDVEVVYNVVNTHNAGFDGIPNAQAGTGGGITVSDPWGINLPGPYAAGTAGYIVGTNIDAVVSTRLATSGYTAPDNSDIAAIKAKTDNLPASPAATGDAMTLTSGERTSIGTAVWASATRTLTSFGTLVSDIWSAATRTLTAFSFTVTTDVASDVAAIKAKTDNLPSSPAATGDAMGVSNAGADAILDRANGVETSWTLRQALRSILAVCSGKLSGAGTVTVTIRDVGDTKDRVTATVDSDGNRTAITYDNT